MAEEIENLKRENEALRKNLLKYGDMITELKVKLVELETNDKKKENQK